MDKEKICKFSDLKDRQPIHVQAEGIDLVVIRYADNVSVLYGRCLHRGALLADGTVKGNDLVCSLHSWDYRIDSGVSAFNNKEALNKFNSFIEDDEVLIDLDEVRSYALNHPQPFNKRNYQGMYADTHPQTTEPYTDFIQDLARSGAVGIGHHGAIISMGVDRNLLPKWEDIQILPAQLQKKPLLDDVTVDTSTVIGPRARKPLVLDIPILVSDMSFGALSREAKIALAMGAEMAGTGICSGEGGMLPEEQSHNSRYFYELASAQFGFKWDLLNKVQAFHFKGGQGAKTGTGGHLPGNKVTDEIAKVRGLKPGEDAISPPTFIGLESPRDFGAEADQIREITGGIPVGFKIAASHIEKDIDFALAAGADYIILDGRGGGTGAAPAILRDNINVPTIPALARARRHLDRHNVTDVTLIITGGLRVPADFAKAMMLGADAIAVSNAALQAIGCLGMRACKSNKCPVGVATQDKHFRDRLVIETSAWQLCNFFQASVKLMKVIARACGYHKLSDFNLNDLTTFNRDMHHLTGIAYGGVVPDRL